MSKPYVTSSMQVLTTSKDGCATRMANGMLELDNMSVLTRSPTPRACGGP